VEREREVGGSEMVGLRVESEGGKGERQRVGGD
jgi:hypothetical protein